MSSPAASPQSAPAADRAAPRRPRRRRCNLPARGDGVMDRLVELETGQPAAMQLGPGRPPIMAPLAQQKPAELMACPGCTPRRAATVPDRASPRVRRHREPTRPSLAGTMQPRQARGIPPIGLDPVAGALGDQRRVDPLNTIAARPRLITEPQLHAVAAELAQQTIQRSRCVRDPAVPPTSVLPLPRRSRG